MWLEKVRIQNFRSIREPGVEVDFTPGMNVVVGANDVGKSAIFEAIRMCLTGASPAALDWPVDDKKAKFRAEVVVRRDAGEAEDFFRAITRLVPLPDGRREQVKAELCERVSLSLVASLEERGSVSSERLGRIGPLETAIGSASTFVYRPTKATGGTTGTDLAHMLQKWLQTNPALSLGDYLNRFYNPESGGPLVNFGHPFGTLLGDLFTRIAESFRRLAEVRQRSQGGRGRSLECWDGTQLANTLHSLKNGGKEAEAQFGQISTLFCKVFPSLTIRTTDIAESPQVCFDKSGLGGWIDAARAGMGPAETLTLITNLMVSANRVIVLEEPELHLHPQAQRSLAVFVRERARENQVFVITHSPYFLDSSALECTYVVKQQAGLTAARKLGQSWNLDESRRMPVLMDESSVRELVFAKAVLLAEGEEEQQALQVWAAESGLPDISVVSAGGNDGFGPRLRLVRELGIPWVAFADKKCQQTKSDLLQKGIIEAEQSDDFVVYGWDDFGGLVEEYREYLARPDDVPAGKSSRRGRLFAQQVRWDKIPEVYTVLDRLQKKATG